MRTFRRHTGASAQMVLLLVPLLATANTYRLPLLPSASDALRDVGGEPRTAG